MKRTLLPVLCLLVLVPPAWCQSVDEKKASIAYLQKLQTKEGGFLAKADDKAPSLRGTSSAVRALGYLGGEVPDPKKAAEFVAKCHDADSGGFANEPGGKPDVFSTAVGAMAVVALKMPVEKYEAGAIKYLGANAKEFEEIRIAVAGLEALGKLPKEAEGWSALVLKLRKQDGSFGSGDGQARDTGGSVVALLRLGSKPEKPEAILQVLNAGQRKDGGFGKEKADGSDLESTYRVLRAYYMLKAKVERLAELKKFIASCRNKDGGYGVMPGQPSTVSGTYYAAIIYHWLGE
jgi:hypothetical protein